MKLEKGMYVRTKQGELGKVISDEMIEFPKDYAKIECLLIGNEIKKASHNIIDLIEVGDYVNGYYVTTGNQGVGSIYIAEIDGLGLKKKLYENEIKTIVTKRQMEIMQYEVK